MMHPEELLEQLKASANPRKQKNLEVINAVCREQYERGSKDFSVATISRLSQKLGGPVNSTIHNKTGDDFKGLIKAWAGHTGGTTRKVRKATTNLIWDVLDCIPDPAVRSVMGSVLAENKKLRGEVNLLKANANISIDFRTAPGENVKSTDSIQILPADFGLTESEKAALRYAISDKFLQDEGWRQDDGGRIQKSDNGRIIFKIGFATAIRKILGVPQASERAGIHPAGHHPGV
jgi:hypothetical protein